MTTRIYYHGTREQNWAPHVGACLATDYEAALSYARWRAGRGEARVYEVQVSDTCLTAEDRSAEVDRDAQRYPGDTAADVARLAAEGLDVVEYDDEDEQGRQLRCVRLLTPAAVAAAVAEELETEEE